MTIEATLERIAVALEKIAGNAPAPEAAEEETSSSSTTAAKDSPKKSGSKGSSKGSSKTRSTKPSAAKESKEDAGGLSKDDVRKALQTLQKKTDAAKARGVLKEFDANTLTELDEGNYAAAIKRAEELAEGGDDE